MVSFTTAVSVGLRRSVFRSKCSLAKGGEEQDDEAIETDEEDDDAVGDGVDRIVFSCFSG